MASPSSLKCTPSAIEATSFREKRLSHPNQRTPNAPSISHTAQQVEEIQDIPNGVTEKPFTKVQRDNIFQGVFSPEFATFGGRR